MINLDLKDKRILYELDQNSRQTNAQIGRKIGLSKQVVGFRIQKLIKNKILTKFYCILDTSKFGFTIHKNFLRLQNITREKEKELIEYIEKNENIVWAASCDGRYDFIISTWARDVEYLDKIIKELNKKFGEFISERQIATIVHGQYLPRDYLTGKKRDSFYEGAFFGAVPFKIKVDDIDWKILFELGKNAKTTAIDISKSTKTTAELVADRIKKLEKNGIIKHYTIVPNEQVYPYLHYKVLISLKNMSEYLESLFTSYCKSNPYIIYMVKSLGLWDFEIDLEVPTVEKFRDIMMDIKSRFQNNIKDYSSLQIYQVHKYNFCPSIIT